MGFSRQTHHETLQEIRNRFLEENVQIKAFTLLFLATGFHFVKSTLEEAVINMFAPVCGFH